MNDYRERKTKLLHGQYCQLTVAVLGQIVSYVLVGYRHDRVSGQMNNSCQQLLKCKPRCTLKMLKICVV